jgi:hypothetical protein
MFIERKFTVFEVGTIAADNAEPGPNLTCSVHQGSRLLEVYSI